MGSSPGAIVAGGGIVGVPEGTDVSGVFDAVDVLVFGAPGVCGIVEVSGALGVLEASGGLATVAVPVGTPTAVPEGPALCVALAGSG